MIKSKNLKGLMKKAIAVTLGITMAFGCLMLPQGNAKNVLPTAMADEFESDGAIYTYSVEDGDRAVIEAVEFSGDTLDIPSEIKTSYGTFPVYKIADKFLNKNETVKTVVFPDTITYIGENVLCNSSVENIKMPNALEHLGDSFASGCKEIKTFECEGANIKVGEMGQCILLDADISNIMNEKGAVCIGNWLVRYQPGDTVHVKFADLGNNGVKVEYINSQTFKYLNEELRCQHHLSESWPLWHTRRKIEALRYTG